jgi:hypothetical protein
VIEMRGSTITGVFVIVNLAVAAKPVAAAFTIYVPAVAFAVNTPDVAMPEVSVDLMLPPGLKLPPAPLTGALNVTVTPPTGLLKASRTLTDRGVAKAVLTFALCPDPLRTAILAGAPALFVREKFAAAGRPATEAETR